jgi:hypothetical protein
MAVRAEIWQRYLECIKARDPVKWRAWRRVATVRERKEILYARATGTRVYVVDLEKARRLHSRHISCAAQEVSCAEGHL